LEGFLKGNRSDTNVGGKMSLEFNVLSQPVKRALTEMGFTTPTPIQREAIPYALEGYDILGQAATGTGKTAAFGIPIIDKVKRKEGIQALVLTPTRELALQVRDQLKAIGRYKGIKSFAFYGGTPVNKNVEAIERFAPEVVIGTPGRIKDLIEREVLDLSGVKILTLDEADVMLDMGFIEDIEFIISKTPKSRQTFINL
jgi:ATP-dependent RNA helicase DeaD